MSMLLFLIGAIIFGKVMVNAELDTWISNSLQVIIGDMPPTFIWIGLMILGCFLAQMIPNLAVLGIFIPVTVSVAQDYGLNPVITALTVGMSANIGIMFPFSSMPIAVTMEDSGEFAPPKDFVLYGLAIVIICPIISMIVGSIIGDYIFPSVR